jgi:protein tyrosine/serine phosphatase
LLLALLSGTPLACAPVAARNPPWAVAIADEEIPNFHRVGNALYRGAQPSDEGFAHLKAMGVKTVVSLRRQHDSREVVEGLGMAYVEIKTTPWNTHQEQQAADLLRIVTDPARQPVFVYCAFGGDRTGAMIAVYRLCVCGWTKPQALEEMRDEQFEFHEIWDDLVTFVADLDVPAVKQQAGLK